MTSQSSLPLVHYHAPHTRSATIRWLFEELGVPHELHVLDRDKNEFKSPAYLAINPLGKVPAIRHGDTVVTEQAAIAMYLADAFPQAGLAPPIGDPRRGTYLRWMVFYHAAVEPAVVDRALGREGGEPSMLPYGTYDDTVEALAGALRPGPYILGETFSAADVIVGSGVRWLMMFGLLPQREEFTSYAARLGERPALQRAVKSDEDLMAKSAAKS